MLIKRIEIDGFKSYASRVVIDNWDQSFNAITGLNGSGKSNILDAICFVLGINNLAQVRARDPNDLIYKQGTAQVRKASVSILFDNRDKKQSPTGFEHKDEFTITRQIAVDQRGKYLIDGQVAQQNKVHTLLQSVQLNVNNPHFLIMQGRVTKVCNMKPEELLGLLEESAGTRMYNQKRSDAVQLLSRKDTKVDEINNVLHNDVQKTMDKLEKDKVNYVTFISNSTAIERLQRLCAAADFVEAEALIDAIERDLDQNKDRLSAGEGTKYSLAQERGTLEARLSEAATRMAGVPEDLQRERDVAQREVSTAEEVIKAARAQIAAYHETARKQAVELLAVEKKRAAAEAVLGKTRAKKDAATAALEETKTSLASLESSLIGLDLEGRDGAEGGTMSAQLAAAEGQVTETQGKIDDVKQRKTQMASELKRAGTDAEKERRAYNEMEGSIGKLQRDAAAAGEKQAAAKRALEAQNLRGDLASVRARVQNQYNELEGEFHRLSSDAKRAKSTVEARTKVSYTPWAGHRENSVKGTIAGLVRVKDSRWAYALEIVAGAKLQHIVVDNEITATDLIKRGQLTSRVTTIPLTKVAARTLTPRQLQRAAELSGGAAIPAVDMIDCAPELRDVVQYALGGAFICEDQRMAEAVAFNPEVRVRCVTIDGDVFDPQGTISGGSRIGNSGVLSLAADVHRLSAAAEEKKHELDAVAAKLQLCDAAEDSERQLAQSQARLEDMQKRLRQTRYVALSEQVNQLTADLGALETELTALTGARKRHDDRRKELEATIRDLERGSEERRKQQESKMAALKKDIPKRTSEEKAAADAVVRAEQDEVSLRDEIARVTERKTGAEQAAEELGRADAARENALAEQQSVLDEVQKRVRRAEEEIERNNSEREGLRKRLDELRTAASNHEAQMKQLKREADDLSSKLGAAKRSKERLLRTHKFIAVDKSRFGQRGSDYDFDAHNMDEKREELTRLQTQQAVLQNTVNHKVMPLYEKAQAEYADLVKKRDIISGDKSKIQATIDDLDKRKQDALERTWDNVNQAFGKIFSTLLPDAMAKLEKHSSASGELTGVEMRVGFSKVWKNSLSELSGGQRSLLALSLILAMLKYSPAPLYILDEVDAALDLSHTQNIGIMLKEQFPHAQFVVVSLKEGMFNNANVLFRTKFVDGVSQVERVVSRRA